MSEDNRNELLALTSDIVSSFLANNNVETDAISGIITDVYKTLSGLGGENSGVEDRPEPAVSIRKSITPDFLICLEDGKKLKMLKRHLKTSYNMTPDDYRERWGLASDYPMVAPNYAAQRSQLAKDIGLGKK